MYTAGDSNGRTLRRGNPSASVAGLTGRVHQTLATARTIIFSSRVDTPQKPETCASVTDSRWTRQTLAVKKTMPIPHASILAMPPELQSATSIYFVVLLLCGTKDMSIGQEDSYAQQNGIGKLTKYRRSQTKGESETPDEGDNRQRRTTK